MKNKYKVGDIIKNGDYTYKVEWRDGKLVVQTKYWGCLSLSNFLASFQKEDK